MRKNLWLAMTTAIVLCAFGATRGGAAEKKDAPPKQETPAAESPPKDAPSAEKKKGPEVESATPDKAIAALQTKGLYTVLVLDKGEASAKDLLTALMPMAKDTGKAECLAASAKDASLNALLKTLKLDPEVLPTPLALVLAPNGIVTGTFRSAPKAEKFAESILPEQPLAIRKALADGKTVIVKMQSPQTTGNAETNKALEEYLADPKNKKTFVVLPLDMDKAENAQFLKQLTITDPGKETKSILLAMAPPLNIVGKPYRGTATKATLGTFFASCGSACGPSG